METRDWSTLQASLEAKIPTLTHAGASRTLGPLTDAEAVTLHRMLVQSQAPKTPRPNHPNVLPPVDEGVAKSVMIKAQFLAWSVEADQAA